MLIAPTAKKYAVVLVVLVCMRGCAGLGPPDPASYPIIHANMLLLDNRAFPAHWEAQPCRPWCNRDERPKHATRVFGRVGYAGRVIQDVYVFDTIRSATNTCVEYRTAEFKAQSPPTRTLTVSPTLTYQGVLADDMAQGCGTDVISMCTVFVRYRNYVIELYFALDRDNGEGVQREAIDPILRDLDRQVSQTFGVPVSKTPLVTPTL